MSTAKVHLFIVECFLIVQRRAEIPLFYARRVRLPLVTGIHATRRTLNMLYCLVSGLLG